MKSVIYFLFVALLIKLSDCKEFRCDYTYNAAIGGWLKFHLIPATFEDARLNCHLEGATLASPTVALKNALVSIAQTKRLPVDGKIMTGIHSTFTKGYYFTIEGVSLDKIRHEWAVGEPNNANNAERCIVMDRFGLLYDAKCSDVRPFVCYKNQTHDITMNEECGTIDHEYEYDQQTGSCYKIHKYRSDWFHAARVCAAEGGYLAIINSPAEAKILTEKYNNQRGPGEHLFLGFLDWTQKQNDWRTMHGETLAEAGYDKFAKSQPDELSQYCGNFFPSGEYDNLQCSTKLIFVCEKDPMNLVC